MVTNAFRLRVWLGLAPEKMGLDSDQAVTNAFRLRVWLGQAALNEELMESLLWSPMPFG